MIHCILLLLGAGLFWGGVGIWDIIEFFNLRLWRKNDCRESR